MLYPLTALLALASVSLGAVFEVQVGMNATGGLATVFTPNQITAKAGDRVEFVFRGKNHTVTQSTFAQPCTQQFNNATSLSGVNSGFMPVSANASQVPVFSIEVMDETAPQWFFCNQANHCNMGMVFAINAPSSGEKTFDNWVQLAKNATHDPTANTFSPSGPASTSPESGSNTNVGSGTGSGTDLGSGSGSSTGSNIGSGSQNLASGSSLGSEATATSFASSPFSTSSAELSRTSSTVFVGSIPANAASGVSSAADTAATTRASAGFKMEPRSVLGMAVLGAMSLALAW